MFLLLVVLTVANARAQIVVNQCETIEFSVVEWPGDRYTWDIYSDLTVNFAKEKGDIGPVPYFEDDMYEGSTVRVNGLEPGKYMVRIMVWDEDKCTNNVGLYRLDVIESKPEATVEGSENCIGEPSVFKIIFTGTGPWDVIYTFGDESNAVNLYGITEPELAVSIPPLPVGVTEVWVMEVVEYKGICRIVNSTPSEKGRVVIFPKPTNSRIYLKE